ncbi:universal stress protein [Halosimplex pelagicum]|uniref:Universal stress protein n=1 Tax=Halosimplex pelagicum TaxID=869886 RepID=A0A7D5T318_9EURY|nr:universal stress protein [Halosimplex pelagicum]QLH80368.1 universal stress protein [Halosimplex pelagicum]
MGTIFVAYGGEGRESVLEFAAERARETGDDLHVYHLRELVGESIDVRSEVEAVLDRTAPGVDASVAVESADDDEAGPSTKRRLAEVAADADRDWTYVVMGDVEHGAVEEFVLPSMTEAVLETRAVPVLLVPV